MAGESDREALLAEYLKLQDIVEDFDKRALTIKAWSVTISAAGIVTSYAEGSTPILAVSTITAFFFWLVEGTWKVNQQCFYGRVRSIEQSFRENNSIAPLQIASQWSLEYHKRKSLFYLWRILWWPHVALPHALLVLFGAGLLIGLQPTPGAAH